jgi:hypothetical protein
MSSANINPETKPAKSVWDTILTSTPVVLTVVATILAGISNSEMTQAQYHRSLAAQYQSKVGDQWAFFQAKKIRASNMENMIDLMHANGKSDANQHKVLAHHLSVALERVALDSQKADESAGGSKPSVATTSAGKRAKIAADIEKRLGAALAAPENTELGYFASEDLPIVAGKWDYDKEIDEVLKALQSGAADAEIDKLAILVKDASLDHALSVARENAKRVDDAAKPVGESLNRIGKIVTEMAELADTGAADLGDKTTEETRGGKERDTAVASEERARAAADRLHHAFSAARARYNFRRLNQDAIYNQAIAWLLEIQVHKSAAESDRHRERSLHFFFGMLVAQAGVAISSMSLAARRKSVLWGLAGFLGIAAVVFSGYVYLYR